MFQDNGINVGIGVDSGAFSGALEMFDNEGINFSVVLKSSFSGKSVCVIGFDLVME